MKSTELLINELKLAKGKGAIIFITCENYMIDEFKEKLNAALKDIVKFEDIFLSSESFEKKYLPGILYNRKVEGINENVVFNIFGFEKARPEIYGYIQLHRETIAGINRPILIWVPEYVFKEIPLKAPDFYRFRSSVYRFIEEEKEDGAMKSVTTPSKDVKTEILKFAKDEEEIKEIKKLLEIDNFLLKDADDDGKISVYSALVDNYAKLRDFEKAEEVGKEGRKIAEKIKNEFWISLFCFKLGRIYYYRKRSDEAEKEYREAIRLNPNLAEAHNGLGLLLYDLKRYEEAEKEYREALKINPNYTEAHNNLGNLLDDLKRYEEAEKEYKEALKLNSNYADAHNNLGVSLQNLKRYEEAEKEYREAILLNPNYADAHNNLGLLLQNLKRYEEAEKEYREAIRINPNLAEAHNNLGLLLQNLKRYEEAEKEYGEAIRLNSDYANAHANLGLLHMQIGKIDDARREVLKAKDLFEKQGKTDEVKRCNEILKNFKF